MTASRSSATSRAREHWIDTHHPHAFQPILLSELGDHRPVIVTEAAVVERRGQVLRASAVSLVQADHIHPRPPGLGGDPTHVVGLARAFQPMQQQDRWALLSLSLPVAVPEHPAVWRHREQPGFGWDASQ